MKIQRIDFVGSSPATPARSSAFFGDTLGLRRDEHRQGFEFWAADTCLNIWEPDSSARSFEPQKTAHLAFQVDDVEQARKDIEAKAVKFEARRSTRAYAT